MIGIGRLLVPASSDGEYNKGQQSFLMSCPRRANPPGDEDEGGNFVFEGESDGLYWSRTKDCL